MIKVFNKILPAVIAMASIFSANAELTLDECQRLAQENYPLISRYDLIEQTTEYSVSNLNKNYVPQLTLSGQATYQSAVPTFPDALQNMMNAGGLEVEGMRKDQYKIALDFNQIIWDGGITSARKKIADSEGEIKRLQNDVELYSVRSRVNELYFGILLLEKKLKINEELGSLLNANRDKMRALLQGGVAMQCDLDKMDVECLKVKQQKKSLNAAKRTFEQMLSVFIGKDVAGYGGLVVPDASMPADTDVSNRPEMELFARQSELVSNREKLQTSIIVPKFSLFAKGWYGYPGLDMFKDMTEHKWSLNGIVGIRFSWNIGELYTHSSKRKKLDIQRSYIETAKDIFVFNNKLLSTQQKENIERYRSMLEEDVQIVKLRESVRKSAESRLDNGITDVNVLLEEIMLENEAQSSQSIHEIEMLKYIYELKNTTNR